MKDTIFALICAIFASTGFWTLVNNIWQSHSKKRSQETRLLLGLAYDRIITLSSFYIKKGSISTEEYHDLYHYLYEPYANSGGNGTAKRLIEEVGRLPIRRDEDDYKQ